MQECTSTPKGSEATPIPFDLNRKADITDLLPLELVFNIFQQLGIKDLVSVNLTSKRWKAICDNEHLWQLICQSNFSICGLESSLLVPEIFKKTELFQETWKKTYRFYATNCVKYTLSDGTVWEKIRNGEGSLTYTDGTKIVGTFRDGRLDGKGIITLPNGEVRIGTFRKGQLNGLGQQILFNGQVHEGPFLNDKLHGRGRIIFANGNIMEKQFVHGHMRETRSFGQMRLEHDNHRMPRKERHDNYRMPLAN